MHTLRRLPLYIIAAIFIFEAWIWDSFHALGMAIVRALPFERLKAAVVAFVERLPPYAALCLFCIPAIVIFPFKIAALWLIAHGHLVLGCGMFFAAKVAGVGAAAFIFDLTSAKLMTLPWFTTLYAKVMEWRDWAHSLVDPYKEKVKAFVQEQRQKALALFRSNGRSDFLRTVTRLRQRIRRART
ncbi:hypothetical protein PY365_21910 [Roseiarcaceae bacterium H3SJ34-1]|uniref:hypothetical protein n=1 Tax=Terripilifer ovatus TaxID=3032367 RepID=UPI003AB92E86|nr:hypothetical protein [Roseiarcaceae bacterium H3SJ34-1]